MQQLFRIILSLSVSGTMVGGIILLIRPVTKRYFSHRWAYYLWLLVLCRLLLPVHVSVNLVDELFTAVQNWQMVQSPNKTSEDAVSESANRNIPENIGALENNSVPENSGVPGNGIAQTSVSELGSRLSNEEMDNNIYADHGTDGSVTVHGLRGWLTGFHLICVVWMIGVIVCALWKIWDYRKFVGNLCRNATLVTNPEVLAMREECRRRLGVRRRVPVYESSAVDRPIMIGFFGSCIIMPPDVPADLMLILHHELVHCRRKDIGYKWLFQLALCVHWFNPFVYLFHRKFCLDCELACDEAVMNSLTENGRKAYGDVLLDMAEQTISCHRNVMAMTLLEEKSTLKERLEGIIRYRKRSVVTVICAVAAAAALFGIALVGGAITGSQDHAGSMKGGLGRLLLSALFGDGTDFMNQEVQISYDGTAYRMYDNDELIAGRDDHDVWRAWIFGGDERSTDCEGLILNGSSTLGILYANCETTIRVNSQFEMADGRMKIVQVMPDGTVRVLNDSGEKTVETIALSEGRNVLKVVGQEARAKNLLFSFDHVAEECFDDIFADEEEEDQKILLQNIAAGELDRAQMRESLTNMDTEQVSELLKLLLEQDVTLYAEDWDAIFTYSDQHLSAEYLAEALEEGKADSFYGKGFDSVALHVSSDDRVTIITSMQRLSYHRLRFGGLAGLNKSQCETCVMHFLDLGNTLTDSQLQELADYVSAKGLERISERNEEIKALQ